MSDKKPLIMLVEDDADLVQLIARILERRGYDIITASTAADARVLIGNNDPDLFILDRTLPDGDGVELCKEINKDKDSHVMFLTGKSETHDKITGLRAGGDYYLTKPFDRKEFMAVVESLLRRAERKSDILNRSLVITKGSLTLKIDERKALVNGYDVGLSPKEFSLLLILVQNEDKEMGVEELYETVWGTPMLNDSNALRQRMSGLKKKLGDMYATDFSILTEHGKGYVFTVG